MRKSLKMCVKYAQKKIVLPNNSSFYFKLILFFRLICIVPTFFSYCSSNSYRYLPTSDRDEFHINVIYLILK